MASVRALIAIVVAIAAGIGLVILDSSPGYDATGITAIGLAIAAFVVVLIDGSGRALRVAMLAVLVGIWIPVLEIAPPGTYAPLLALGFATRRCPRRVDAPAIRPPAVGAAIRRSCLRSSASTTSSCRSLPAARTRRAPSTAVSWA